MKTDKSFHLILLVLFTALASCEIEEPKSTPTYILYVLASPSEGGTLTVSSSSGPNDINVDGLPDYGPYTEGQTVTLTPQPNPNWVFEKWERDASGFSNPLTLAMNTDKNITAVFVKRDYPLNITIEGGGSVSEVIVTNPAGREYPHGTTMELTPVPEEGWVFESWGGDLSGSEVPQRITVDGERNVTVKFKLRELFYLAENSITCKCEGANPGEKGLINGVEYEAVDNNLLRQRRDQAVDMTRLCTSLVTDMSELFYAKVEFNQAIGNWDVSKVTNMGSMFSFSPFNQPVGDWNAGNVTNMQYMFTNSPFNQPIGDWDVSNVTNMGWMFSGSQFNQPIGDWNVGKVTNMEAMFNISPFNQPIGVWNVSQVTNMAIMFSNSLFNQPIGDWDVSNVTDMKWMFSTTPFNQPIGDWEVGKVTDMSLMFAFSLFDQPIGSWDVSNVTDMKSMFLRSPFNQPLGNWNIKNVTNMHEMFSNTPFNQPIGDWDVSKVTNMLLMFSDSPFNQPIGNWDVGNVTSMAAMFGGNANFNQDLSKWCVEKIPERPEGFPAEVTAWTLPEPVWGTCPD